MKNKSLITNRRKKSIASLFLAFLLMFSFNSTPLILLADKTRNSKAYKPTSSQTFYSNTASELEQNFSDGKYISSLEQYFDGSTKNFNVLTYYNTKFEEYYKSIVEKFLKNWDGSYAGTDNDYDNKFSELLSAFGVESLYEVYTNLKDGTYLKSQISEKDYSVESFRDFVELVALYGLPEYNDGKTLPPILASFASGGENETTKDNIFKNLSTFYRLVRSYDDNNNYDSFTDDNGSVDDQGQSDNDKITSRSSFYLTNTHYVELSKKIENKILETAPAYVFDGETQDTNIAGIFANNAPLSAYEYSGYETYTTPNITYETTTLSGVTYRKVYFWDKLSNETVDTSKLSGDSFYLAHKDDGVYVISSLTDKETNVNNMIYYRRILEGEDGYNENVATYYKIERLNYVYILSNYYSLYTVNDDPSQSQLDTYSSIYVTPITQNDLDEDMGKTYNSLTGDYTYNSPDDRYYVNIPYEEDELYFKYVYINLLFSRPSGFEFEDFVKYFTYNVNGTTKSNLYLKYRPTSATNVVYVDGDISAFKSTYSDYSYQTKSFDYSSSISSDYEEITSSNSTYLPSGFKNDSTEYKLYFKKARVASGTNSIYSGYEQVKDILTNLEQDTIASSAYEQISIYDSAYKIYILDDGTLLTEEGEATETLTSLSLTKDNVLKQSTIDNNPNYYVPAPTFAYTDNNIDTKYKLYYKHTDTTADKIYVVDDSDDAENNKIYKTMNFHVITSSEYQDNYSNYLLITENDAIYNENFLLYYKYDRTILTDTYYILKDDLPENFDSSKYSYSYVGSGELSDYVLINEQEDTKGIYSTVRNSLFVDGSTTETLHIYYKLSDVFVQNELKKGNAIYVIDSSISSGERETYSANWWTVITKDDVNNNPGLYVLVSEKDPNYSEDYTLYYRYIESNLTNNKVYSIDDIDTTSSDFNSKDYKLINDGEYGYVRGEENYYKKIISSIENVYEKTQSYYYYQTSSTVALAANGYFAISFYVYTVGDNARASVIMKDTAGIMSDIKIDNINTAGKWQKYYVFLSTDVATASTINIYLYLGDEEHGIKGNTSLSDTDTLTASVFFDNIEVTKIGITDYNKQAIANEPVYSIKLTEGEGDEKTIVPDAYADKYNNQIFIANEEALKSESDGRRFENNIYDYKYVMNNSESVADYKNYTWNSIFDFDHASDNLKNILGYTTRSNSDENDTDESSTSTTITNNLLSTLGTKDIEHSRYNITGYDMYNLYEGNTITTSNDLFPTLWRYYISRDLGRDGLNLNKTLNAYAVGDLDVTITNDIEKTKVDDDDEDEDDEENEDDIIYVSDPFNSNNFALKLTNKNNDVTLGITSNAFTIEQFGYYKITVWIYSPDKDGKASLSLNSVRYSSSGNQQGSLLSANIDSTYANMANSSASNDEYGWIPVTFYVEGNARRDMQCYLVLSACKNSTVYFDNITIEKITSKIYDNNTSSSSYSNALTLTPSDTYDNAGIKNGNFNYIAETNATNTTNSTEPRTADSWTEVSTNSKNAIAGVVSLGNQSAFFGKYAGNQIPYDGLDNYSNIYAIYTPTETDSLETDENTGNKLKVETKHNYSIYSGSYSLSSGYVYKISFKFYKDASFSGSLISNIYLSSVKTTNIFATLNVDAEDIGNGWQTFTYYIQTGTSSQTIYLEIGVENANGLCYFKNVYAGKDDSTKTYDEILAEVVGNYYEGLSTTPSENIYNAIKNIRFVNMADMDFSYHTPSENENTGLFDQNILTDNTETTDKHTSGKTGVVVSSYFDTVKTTTYSVTINKVTYYIGEVYEFTIDETKYYVHKTYDSASNTYGYKLYSDSALTQEITKIGEDDVQIQTNETSVKVTIGSTEYKDDAITTTYRLYKFSDLREEVTEIDGDEVRVENLNKVVVGTGDDATENTTTSETNTSYIYHFVSQNHEFNNTIIPSSELVNNQSGNVLILANGYSTDYITLTQTTTRTIGTSTYNVLRIYVKTSDFDSADFGLNIEISAIDTKWTNINTTNSKYADEYGFVCYEVLISTNSSDSISDFAIKLSLGNEDNLGYGYAIISDISLETFGSEEAFTHYSELVGDDKETVKKKLYEETATDDDETNEDNEEETDDKNSVSWATFFYVFSSILLVVTMAVAMVALVLKKHPIKFAKKYANEHDRDIDSISSKKSNNFSNTSDTSSKYGAEAKEKKNSKDRNNSDGII